MNFIQKLFGFKKMATQAEMVSVWIDREDDDSCAWVAILNNSKMPIYKMILSTVNTQSKASSGKETPFDHRTFLTIVPPGKFYTKIQIHHGMSFSSGIEFAFTDSSGNSWMCNGDGIMTKLKQQPYEYYNLILPLSWENPLSEIS